MSLCEVEFTIEPFDEGRPGPHVTKAIEAAEATGVEVAVGPFGTALEGGADEVAAAVGAALKVALAEGATRVSVTVTNPNAAGADSPVHPLLEALRPVLDAVGGSPVVPALLTQSDVPIEWEGEVIGGIRLQSLEGALPRMVDQIAADFGRGLSDLNREEKQQAVRMLYDRGAFFLRGAVEEIADLMDVSRITVYNYLNAIRDRRSG
jgi:uncharacterized protein YqgV (UPF0045/DUF77 family)